MTKAKEILQKILEAADDAVHRPWLNDLVKATPNKVDDIVLQVAQDLLDSLQKRFGSTMPPK